MDFGHYDVLRPFGYFTTLHIGFTAFLSSYISGRTERTALHLVNRRRMLELQDAVDAIVSSAEGLSLHDRVDILAGSAMCSATAAMSVVVAECKALYYRAPRPVVLLRPPIDVCRPLIASDSAYPALTLCVFPHHRGYLESYEMDHGVRLAKAGMLVAEYDGFSVHVKSRYGHVLSERVVKLVIRLRFSILTRLRSLSLTFVPIGSRDEPFFRILLHVRQLCRAGGSCYRTAQSDPLRPRAYKRLYVDMSPLSS